MPRTGGKDLEILDAAERAIRARGYNAVSFRDLAAAVGVKSASVHHHFPTKADLGAAVARRYAERFLDALGDPGDLAVEPHDLVGRYVKAFRSSLEQDGQMCLCGMLAAEIAGLPDTVAAEARRFFLLNLDWLETVLLRGQDADKASDGESGRDRALSVIATLEGALILGRAFGDLESFDRAARAVSRGLDGESPG